jgi:hypothetical protein
LVGWFFGSGVSGACHPEFTEYIAKIPTFDCPSQTRIGGLEKILPIDLVHASSVTLYPDSIFIYWALVELIPVMYVQSTVLRKRATVRSSLSMMDGGGTLKATCNWTSAEEQQLGI